MTAPFRTTRLAPLLGFCLLLVTAATALAADAWQPYVNSEFGLSTVMPGTPAITVKDRPETAESYGAHSVIASVDPDPQHGYTLYMSRLSQPPDNLDAMLEGLTNQMAAAASAPVISSERGDFNGLPKIDAIVGPDRLGQYYRIRIIVRGTDMIQLIASREGQPPPVDAFYTSFKFDDAAP